MNNFIAQTLLAYRTYAVNQPLNAFFKFGSWTSGIQAHKTASFFAVCVSGHDGDFLLVDERFLQCVVINVERTQVNPCQIGGLRNLPVQFGECGIKLAGDVMQIAGKVIPQRIKPACTLMIGGNMCAQRENCW